MNKNKAILVTGGTGFVGSYILRNLVLLGYENIRAIHRASSSFDLVKDVKDKINWIEADILDRVTLDEAVQEVDIVIHSAAMISFWPKEYKKMLQVNIEGTALIVDLCLHHKVERFIYLSSVEAFGKEENGAPISEITEWKDEHALSNYATSKHYAELEVWRGKEEGLNVTIYNPSFILGAGHWNVGPMAIFRDIFKGLKYYPKGSIGIVDVRDVADIICKNITNRKMDGQQYILSNSSISYQELFTIISNALEVKPPSKLLTSLLAKVVIPIESIRSRLLQTKPLINKETYNITKVNLDYNTQKLHNTINFKYKETARTIRDTANSFLNSYHQGQTFGQF